MRKVYVTLTVNLQLNVDEGVEICHVVNEMDYSFQDTTMQAEVIDSSIQDYTVTDSK